MITRLRQRLTRPDIHDDSGSMLLALFAVVILTSLVSVVLMVTISQQAKTRKGTDFTFAGQAAETAVSDALLTANKNGAPGSPDDMRNWDKAVPMPPREGVTGEFRWSWWWDSGEVLGATSTMEIHATGCRNNATTSTCAPNSSRTMIATLSGLVVKGVGGEPGYSLDPDHNFGRALFADEDLVLRGDTQVTSYDSAGVDNGYGQVATNGVAAFGSGADVDGIYFSNTQFQTSGDRCSGPLCSSTKVHLIRPRLQVDADFIKAKCDALEAPPVPWVASDAGGTFDIPDGDYLCYSSLTFDVSTTINGGATGVPGQVYVTGPVTVGANVVGEKVVVNALDVNPASSKLQIYSSGDVVSIAPGDTEANSAQVAWALWAPLATCSTNGAGYITVYGSMVCRKVSVQGNFTATWDEGLRGLATEPAGIHTVWDIGGSREG